MSEDTKPVLDEEYVDPLQLDEQAITALYALLNDLPDITTRRLREYVERFPYHEEQKNDQELLGHIIQYIVWEDNHDVWDRVLVPDGNTYEQVFLDLYKMRAAVLGHHRTNGIYRLIKW